MILLVAAAFALGLGLTLMTAGRLRGVGAPKRAEPASIQSPAPAEFGVQRC
jgi:hypothetical protein